LIFAKPKVGDSVPDAGDRKAVKRKSDRAMA